MKRLFSPPIQLIFWLSSSVCLGLAAWHLMQLRLVDEDHSRSARVSVQIPESLMLTEPAVMTYSRMVQAPLFWPSRAIPVVEVATPTPPPTIAPEVPPPPAQAPTGRLVGIVNVGANKYALIRTEEKNLSLHIGEQWEGWTLESIDTKKISLVAGEQKQEVKLIADFAPPAENQQLAQLRKKEEQKQQMAAARQQQAQQAATAPESLAIPPNLEPATAEQAQAAVAQNPPPVMSLKEALEARQRLMASRWGANTAADGAGGQQASPGAVAPITTNR
ncbi:hypothetical protein [uncultured Thiothrix sp.]|uniref:hypothetical protein n=1 Tax=uncultured Thiothrix sp. TaxID=223185 RepID=UPI002627FE6A|nr:hypothetical protein [uncultured Thiothrix sp.]HMT94648.1 hypothetical protein [Thiolinea sp.]